MGTNQESHSLLKAIDAAKFTGYYVDAGIDPLVGLYYVTNDEEDVFFMGRVLNRLPKSKHYLSEETVFDEEDKDPFRSIQVSDLDYFSEFAFFKTEEEAKAALKNTVKAWHKKFGG